MKQSNESKEEGGTGGLRERLGGREEQEKGGRGGGRVEEEI